MIPFLLAFLVLRWDQIVMSAVAGLGALSGTAMIGQPSDAGYAFFGTLVVCFFGAGGYFHVRQSRKVEKVAERVQTNTSTATAAKSGLDSLLPLVAELQQKVEDAERDRQETRVLLAAHGQWDLQVLAEVRALKPNFPAPPPLIRLDPDAFVLSEDEVNRQSLGPQ